MSDAPEEQARSSDPATEAARRRRRAQVFGDVLPETTSDERGDGVAEPESASEAWLRRQVPPHHG